MAQKNGLYNTFLRFCLETWIKDGGILGTEWMCDWLYYKWGEKGVWRMGGGGFLGGFLLWRLGFCLELGLRMGEERVERVVVDFLLTFLERGGKAGRRGFIGLAWCLFDCFDDGNGL